MLSFTQKLQNYADLIVKVGVGVQPGQRLLVNAPLETAPLVRRIAASAYQTGARLVDVMWQDDDLTLIRFQYAPHNSFEEFATWRTDALTKIAEQGDALLSILASDPGLLEDQDPELIAIAQRVRDEHMLTFRQKVMQDAFNWSIISIPITSWANKIFPDDTPDAQLSKLWDIILKICRADQPYPIAAWEKHLADLEFRQNYLNAKQYTVLRYNAPGTDLTVGLPNNHIWIGGRSHTPTSIPFVRNIPTEEIFTLPNKDHTEGIVTATKPLSYGGVVIEEFSLTFEKGRVVNMTGGRNKETFKKLIKTDEGAACLGEVALVPHSSPISQSGITFYNTLYDENAASHLAMGRAFRACLENGASMSDEEFAIAGGNFSLIHTDFMIGSQHIDIDGITHDGATEPVMRAGEWAF